MSVDTAQVLQIAHKKKTTIEEFLEQFAAGTAFSGVCRHYDSLDGYKPKIVKRGDWYMATVIFSATNWDMETAKKLLDDSYVVQIGIVDDRQSISNVFADDETDEEGRLDVFHFEF
jgi:hypothetical protein